MEGHYHSTTGHSRPPSMIRLPARMGITEDKPSRLFFRNLPYLHTFFQIKHNRMMPVSPAFLSPTPLLLAHPARQLGSIASGVPRSSISGTNLKNTNDSMIHLSPVRWMGASSVCSTGRTFAYTWMPGTRMQIHPGYTACTPVASMRVMAVLLSRGGTTSIAIYDRNTAGQRIHSNHVPQQFHVFK